jgi:ATP-dependent Clp protease protease subunit
VSQGHIYIHGNIGTYTNEKGVEVKGVELLDVISQVKSQPKATSFLVHIGSPGGLVDTGDQIYDYLMSVKASGVNVDTISDSYIDTETGEAKAGIGSIATKPFLAGTTRSIIEGHEFFIHNPWTQITGDTVKVKAELKGLEQTETALRAFYQSHTKVTDVGLKALMDNETAMPADMAVSLGFATRKVATQKIKALAQLNNNKNMAETKTFAQMVGELTDSIKALLPNAPKAALPGEGADPAAPAQEGAAGLPDGEHPMADGKVIVVEGGMIKEVKMPAAAAQPAAPAAPAAPTAAEKALLDKITALEQSNLAMKEEQDKALKALSDFQATMVAGKTPSKAFNNNGGNGDPAAFKTRSIGAELMAKREERKKSINKN